MGDFLSSLSSLAPSVALLGAGKSNFDSRMQAVTLANKAREAEAKTEALTEALAGADDFTYEQVQSVLLANGEAEAALRMMPNVQAERKTAGTLAAFQGADLSTPQGNTLVGQALIAAGNPKGADYIKAGVEMGRKETAAANTLAYLEQLYPGRFTSGEGIDLNSLLLKGVTAEQALAAQTADRAYKEAQTLLKHNRAQENIRLKESLKGSKPGARFTGTDKEWKERADTLGFEYDWLRKKALEWGPKLGAGGATQLTQGWLKAAVSGSTLKDFATYITTAGTESIIPKEITIPPTPIVPLEELGVSADSPMVSFQSYLGEISEPAGARAAAQRDLDMRADSITNLFKVETVKPLSPEWVQAIGPDAERIHGELVASDIRRKVTDATKKLVAKGYGKKARRYIINKALLANGIELEPVSTPSGFDYEGAP